MIEPIMATVFGPPSERIDIAAFLQSAQAVTSVPSTDILTELPQDQLCNVLAECSVNDVQKSLYDVWNNPRLSAHLLKEHALAIDSMHVRKNPLKKRRSYLTDPAELPQEVVEMQKELDTVKLDSWKLQPEAAVFIRTTRNSDNNTIGLAKPSPVSESLQGALAIIMVSVYERTRWNTGLLTRMSRHALLSSQTLGQLFDVIPCSSKETPREIVQDGKVVGYTSNEAATNDGCVICIEGCAYGDGYHDNDYACRLMEQLKKDKVAHVVKATMTMRETLFETLVLRINEPYWLLHAGCCEHFVVIDQIRLWHKSDPSSGYPLTLQMTPLLLDLCRTCGKVPAVWSIVNDGRLGDSPYLICAPCWRNIEEGKGEGVVVVPLPKHRAGWW